MTDTFVHALMPRSGEATTTIRGLRSDRSLRGPGARDTGSKQVPDYLRRHYWWAYIHPRAVKFFERQWLVSAILWGNYERLRDAALAELGKQSGDQARESRPTTLQVACAYGDLTLRLAQECEAANGSLDVADVLPIQLHNLRGKLPPGSRVRLLEMDAADLKLPDGSYDRALVFFLLHEQPSAIRRRTLQEVLRVVKPDGKIVIVDYARPRWWHPARYLWCILLAALEPFALDLWQHEVSTWMPNTCTWKAQSRSFFGGLYQMTTFIRE